MIDKVVISDNFGLDLKIRQTTSQVKPQDILQFISKNIEYDNTSTEKDNKIYYITLKFFGSDLLIDCDNEGCDDIAQELRYIADEIQSINT